MRRIAQEPLFQFLFIGLGLFLLYGALNPTEDSNQITINDSVVNEITAKFEMQWKRQPTVTELANLVEAYLDQEVLYRQALQMNLDHDDEIIKRRMAQKMEFLSDDLSASLEPDARTLEAFFENNKENYAKPAVYSLRQIYFSPDTRDDPWKDAEELLENPPQTYSGDRISLPEHFSNTNATRLSIDFGQSFTTALDTLPMQTWAGPVRSGLGIHLVMIEEKTPSGYFSFEEVKEKVSLDYNYKASKDFQEKLITSLLENYTIQIEVSNGELQNMLRERY